MKDPVAPELDMDENTIEESFEDEVYVFPASFGQKRLWFLDQFEPGSPAYNIPSAFRLRGPLKIDLFLKAIHKIVDRHESLRTTFDYIDDETVQIIHPDLKLTVPVMNLQDIEPIQREEELLRLASQEARTPFNLKKGPLTRITILKVDAEDHAILLTLHHIISDGWSMGILVSEISALYAAFVQNQPTPLAELPLQYPDYAEWQNEYMQGEVLDQQLAYWKAHLGSNPPVLELPTDRPRPVNQSSAGDSVSQNIPKELTAAIKKAGQKEGATLFMTLLATFKILLSRYSGQNNISVGTPIANRTQGETETVIGLFINTLVLRTDFEPSTTVSELFQKVRATTLNAYEHQDLPFEYLVDSLQTERDMGHSPLFQVMFILQNAPAKMQKVSDLTMEMLDVNMGTSTFDLTLSAAESPAGLNITAEYNTDLFDRDTIERFLIHYKILLQSISENPQSTIAEIPILPVVELDLLTSRWNTNLSDFRDDALIQQLFEEQVLKNPQSVAVISDTQQLTYGELNQKANQLAYFLRSKGAGPEVRVGLSLERSIQMIIGLLGILKSGAAYVPLDPNYPQERLDYIIEDAGISVLLTQQSLSDKFKRDQLEIFCLDSEWAAISNESQTQNPDIQIWPQNTAYIIYTSGSTGLPKGVMVSHRSVVNHNQAVKKLFDLQSEDRVLQFATINFDAAVEEIFPTLQNGGVLVLRGTEILISGSELIKLIQKEKLTILDLPTAYWHQWVNEITELEAKIPDSLKLVILGGDKASAEHVYRWNKIGGQSVRLLNTYGPTETTIISTAYEMADPVAESESMQEMPIGKPIDNTFTYILDKNLQPVPVGVPGELHIGGEGLARGYLNKADITAAQFIPDPFARTVGMRLYKTGDLVKYRKDGNIEFVGRVDFQVKVRGFRVEPGEIEKTLLEHEQITETVVIVHDEGPAEKQLYAYCVCSEDVSLSTEILREYLLNTLPEYMIPAVFIFLKEIPLTENGKINRKALPKPDQQHILESGTTEFVAPRTPQEETIAKLSAQVLGLDKIGVLHNFFELGGHSLLATQLISRINKTFKTEVPLRKIFETPTVSGLALATEEALQSQSHLGIPPIEPVNRDREIPLSFAQHRLWFLDQLEPNSPFYNLPETYRLRGPLEKEILEKSINAIIKRHESLRTIFQSEDGKPFQKIEETFEFKLQINDISAVPESEKEQLLKTITKEKALTPISLTELPLFNFNLVKLDEHDHAVILIMHHIISDNWSSQILMTEMAILYESFLNNTPAPLANLPIQYADFAFWQRNWLQGEILEQHLNYWRTQLSGAPPVLEMPTDHPRPAMQTFNGDYIQFHLSSKTSSRIKQIAQDQGATLFMTLLAAFNVLIYRYSGQDDISIGTPIANRNRAEIEHLIGFFVNTLVMRSDLSGNPRFTELIKRIKEVALGAYAHQDLPFEKIVDTVQPERDMSHSPLFQVMFALQSSAASDVKLQGASALTLSPIEAHSKTSKFDLTLFMLEDQDRLGGALEYNTDLYDAATIERLIEHFTLLLEQLAEHPDQHIAQIPLLSKKDQERLMTTWNGQTRALHFDQNIVSIFEDQVGRNPDQIAVVFQDKHLSYQQLNKKANQIARFLHQSGIGTDDLVGISLPRSFNMIAAILGVLKAGAAYVPIDSTYPQERINYIVSDSGIPVILTATETSSFFDEISIRTVNLDDDLLNIDTLPIENSNITLHPDNLAYMIYTSGSTGKPKGTLITHRGLTNYLNWTYWAYPLEEGQGSLVHSTIAFDATVTSLFSPILSGKTLTLIAEDNDLEALSKALLDTETFSIVKITPAHLDMLSQQIPSEKAAGLVKAFIIGGENLTADQIRFWQENAPETLLFNEYGPTETVVGCVVYEAKKWRGQGSVPIGQAIPNTQVYILDSYLQPVPVGASGELYIGGQGLARGYKNRPDLTAELFIPDPFSEVSGSRLYKTGDLVKYLAEGNMQFLSRIDDQVKIRGYRIELGEIEVALSGFDSIEEAIVLAREDKPGDRRLVAYFLCTSEMSPSASQLRQFLKERLPEYMIPAIFMQLEHFPLTANGKVDRKALPKPDFSRPELDSTFVSPRTEDEQRLAQIWQELLDIEKVGIFDSFFELGGHSLIATQLISRIREAFELELELRILFEDPTISGLIHSLEKARTQKSLPKAPKLKKMPREGHIPVSFAQQRLWFLDQLAPATAFYNLPTAMRLKGPLNIAILEQTLKEITARHEVLRTTFSFVEGQPIQIVDPNFEAELEITDLCSLEAEAQESTILEMATQEAQEPFDLEVGPLLRVKLLKISQADHVILFTMHHIISDGWSINILMGEVSALYNSFHQGLPSPLQPLTLQYADFTIWQRNWLTETVLESQINYWKKQIGLNPTVLHLPTDRPRPAVQTFNGDVISAVIPEEISIPLKKIGKQEGATLFMTLLAAFQTLIYRYSSQNEFLVGSPIAARNHLETEGLIGFFVNTLVLKADFSDNPGFTELLHQVKETTLGAYSNQDLPFEQLVEILQPERDMSHSPLFQVMFVLQNTPLPRGTMADDLQMEALEAKDKTAKFDLSFVVIEDADRFQCELEFNTDLFDHSSIERLFTHFTVLLKQIINQPHKPVSELSLLEKSDQKLVTQEWNRTAKDFPNQKTVQELFEEKVERIPQVQAVVFENEILTYAELNTRANQLAHFLREQGAGPETVVGISVNRSLDLVIGLLGILKSGAVYLPIDPGYPTERIQYILNDSAVKHVLTSAGIDIQLSSEDIQVTNLDSNSKTIHSFSEENPDNLNNPQNLAYIIYTSGSTGRPKGTMLQHRGLVNLTSALAGAYQVGEGKRCLQFASFSFDASVEEIFTALTNGATLVLVRKETLLSGTGLIETLKTQKITNVTLPPSVLSILTPKDFPDLVTVVSAGEACSRELTEKWARERHFVNGYGPTENTVCSTVFPVTSTIETSTVPIGKPLQNIQTYILDSRLNPVPLGVPGELYLAGVGLARGYLNRPDLSAEKFLPNPFSGKPGERMYKTGDLTRFLSDGNIEFLGRIDQQVKVRGFRIELGEVEAFISEQPEIRDSIVMATKISDTDHRLIAYLIGDPDVKINMKQLKETLKRQLPDYMVPVAFMQLSQFPLTPNGKVDLRALPQPENLDIAGKSAFIKPRNTTEARLCAIWEELLKITSVGIDDNFFDLGGHSLLAMRLLTQIEEQFGKDIQLVSLFQEPTIRHLAKVITDESQSETTAKLIPMNKGTIGTPVYFIHPSGGSVHHYSELVKYLDPDIPFFGVQAKGMDSKEELHTSIEAMASAYVELILEQQPQGPYYLGSYSFGVIVVYEMARQLVTMGHRIGLLAQLDQGPEIDDDLYADDAEMLAKLFKRYFKLDVGHLRALDKEDMFKFVFKKAKKAKIIPRFIRLKEFSHYIRVNQTQTQAWLRYNINPLKVDLTLFRSEENKAAAEPELGWKKFINGTITIIDVPGDHLSMLKEPHVQKLAVKLQLAMEE